MFLQDAQVIALYENGKSCADIAKIIGCSVTSIYNKLQSLCVKMRSRSESNQLFPDSIFISLYNIGLSSSQIGRLLGVDPSTVRKRLNTIGFPLRSRGVASKIRYTEEEFRLYFMVPEVINTLINLSSN